MGAILTKYRSDEILQKPLAPTIPQSLSEPVGLVSNLSVLMGFGSSYWEK